MSTTLYRHFGHDGTLLYVGIANEPPARLRQHRGDKEWWIDVRNTTHQVFETRPEAEDAERKAIHNEHPAWNIQYNRQPKKTKPEPTKPVKEPAPRAVPLAYPDNASKILGLQPAASMDREALDAARRAAVLIYVATYRPAYMEGPVSYLAYDVEAAYPELFPEYGEGSEYAGYMPNPSAYSVVQDLWRKDQLIIQNSCPDVWGSSWCLRTDDIMVPEADLHRIRGQ